MCEACNLGLGKEIIPLRLAIGIVIARLKNKGSGNDAESSQV